MNLLYNVRKLSKLKKPFLTIGIFDGVHKGHQKLIKTLVRKARAEKRKTAVITFAPHPYKILHPEKTPPMILSLNHRLKIFETLGVDFALVLKFDKKFLKLTTADFVRKILVGCLNVGALFVGDNFRMGCGRKGDLNILKKLSRKYKFALNIIDCRKKGGKLISSTLIRKYILEGKLKAASFLLGRRVSLLGTVIHGDKRGRILGFPTANLNLHHEAVPPSGVYAVLIRLDKRTYKGILNIGFRPTFKKNREKTVEVHIFDFNNRIYGKDLEVIFMRKIRIERHFKNKNRLKEQIRKDSEKAGIILK